MDDSDELEEVNLVRTEDDAISWLREMTGCSVDHARRALKQTGGDISDALDVLPTLQDTSRSTEEEIRKLIDTADVRTSSSLHAAIITDITDNHNVIDIPADDVVIAKSDVIVVGDDVTTIEKDGEETTVERIVKMTGVSVSRVQAALRLSGNDERAAVDIILRQNTRHSQTSAALPSQRKRRRSGEPTTERAPAASNLGPKELLLLCWNVDGLCDRGRSERFSAIISEIKTLKPHLVMLQEVVDEHVGRMKSLFGQSYNLTFGDRSSSYFNVILITKTVGNLKIIDKNVRKFPDSIMDRHFVQVVCELYGKELTLYTTHLESMKDHSAERTNQMNKVFEHIRKEDRPGIVIVGGDTNLRDSEMKRIKYTDQFQDVWEFVGRDPSTRYTWDTSLNKNTGVSYSSRLRFDRIFLRSTPLCNPTSLTLVGKTLLPSCDMFPSDHWGLLAKFNIL